MENLIDLFFHLDKHLAEFVGMYGGWIYALLFLIIFAETGLVVTPFLPGDSLLFATGALGAAGVLDVRAVLFLLAVAAVLGNTVNYSVGRFAGPRVFSAEDRAGFIHRLLNRDHLARGHAFFERHGGKAVILGRFVPIVRTFVPFVAGCASMTYSRFTIYNVAGSLAWVGLCVGAGYAFGNVPAIKNNFSLVTIGIVAVSLLPVALEYLRHRRAAAN